MELKVYNTLTRKKETFTPITFIDQLAVCFKKTDLTGSSPDINSKCILFHFRSSSVLRVVSKTTHFIVLKFF